jgi:hypothetical protein
MDGPVIEGAPTSVSAVVGTHREPLAGRVRSFEEFLELLGAEPGSTGLARQGSPGALALAVHGFFANGGTELHVLGVPSEAEVAAAVRSVPDLPRVALLAAPGHTSPAVHAALVQAAASRPGLFAVLDPPPSLDLDGLLDWRRDAPRGAAAVYAPWVVVEHGGREVLAPPSGHVLGVLARLSRTRGVWKAPAGIDASVRGVVRREQELGDADQALLHPEGVNVLRTFPSAGVVVWGATTGGGVGPSRHIATVRLLSWLARSLDLGTKWVAEHESGEALWAAVRRSIGAFLAEVHREGGLAGTRPEEAFVVRCDRTTMTPADLAAGRLVALVGVAVSRPGAFVYLRMLQVTREGSTPSP